MTSDLSGEAGTLAFDQLLCWLGRSTGQETTLPAAIWPSLLTLIDRHRVAAPVGQRLHNQLIDCPASFRQALQQRLLVNTHRALLQASELARLAGRFASADLPLITFKGPALAINYYGAVNHRHAGDLDLLVAPATLWQADRLLVEAGYRRIGTDTLTRAQLNQYVRHYGHHLIYRHDHHDLLIELHWRWFDQPYLLPLDFDTAWQRHRTLNISGTPVAVPEPGDHLLYLCCHGAVHAWSRLQWLYDLPRIYHQYPDDLAALHDRAGQLGVQRMLAQGLMTAHRFLSMPVTLPTGYSSADRRAIPLLIKAAEDNLTDNRHEQISRSKLSVRLVYLGYWLRYRLQLCPDRRYRYRVLTGLWTFKLQDWQQLRLPRGLIWLYPLLRPLLWLQRRWRIRR